MTRRCQDLSVRAHLARDFVARAHLARFFGSGSLGSGSLGSDLLAREFRGLGLVWLDVRSASIRLVATGVIPTRHMPDAASAEQRPSLAPRFWVSEPSAVQPNGWCSARTSSYGRIHSERILEKARRWSERCVTGGNLTEASQHVSDREASAPMRNIECQPTLSSRCTHRH